MGGIIEKARAYSADMNEACDKAAERIENDLRLATFDGDIIACRNLDQQQDIVNAARPAEINEWMKDHMGNLALAYGIDQYRAGVLAQLDSAYQADRIG